jgi:hypothetical protein
MFLNCAAYFPHVNLQILVSIILYNLPRDGKIILQLALICVLFIKFCYTVMESKHTDGQKLPPHSVFNRF